VKPARLAIGVACCEAHGLALVVHDQLATEKQKHLGADLWQRQKRGRVREGEGEGSMGGALSKEHNMREQHETRTSLAVRWVDMRIGKPYDKVAFEIQDGYDVRQPSPT
jgi:hypothetical protein